MRVSSSTRSPQHVPALERAGFKAILVGLCLASLLTWADLSSAKTPGSTYCFYGTCHRVKSIAETEQAVGKDVVLAASFYDHCKRDRYNPCGLTSSGEPFDAGRPDNAASPIYPDGTTLLVWSPDTQQATVLRVNNAGPYWGNRKLDVSRAAAEVLGFSHRGVAKLQVRVVDAPDREEATYKKGRSYEPVLGYIGQYASLDAAEAGMAALMGLETAATSMLAPLSGTVALAQRSKPAAKRSHIVAAAARRVARQGTTVVAQKEPDLADFPREMVRLIDSVATLFDPQKPAKSTAETRIAAAKPAARPAATAKSRTKVASRATKSSKRKQVAARKSTKQGTATKTAAAAKAKKPVVAVQRGTPPNDNAWFRREFSGNSGAKKYSSKAPAGNQKRAQLKAPGRSASLKASGRVQVAVLSGVTPGQAGPLPSLTGAAPRLPVLDGWRPEAPDGRQKRQLPPTVA